MEETNFKEKAYKILYEEYKSLFESINREARSKIEYGKDEDKIDLLSNIADSDKYSHCGLIRKEDIKVVQTLEECLGEHKLVAK